MARTRQEHLVLLQVVQVGEARRAQEQQHRLAAVRARSRGLLLVRTRSGSERATASSGNGDGRGRGLCAAGQHHLALELQAADLGAQQEGVVQLAGDAVELEIHVRVAQLQGGWRHRSGASVRGNDCTVLRMDM